MSTDPVPATAADGRTGTGGPWLPLGMAYALYVLLYASGHFLGSNWVNYAGAVLVLWIVYLSGSFRWEKEPAPLLAFFLLLWPSFGTVFGVSEHVFLAWFKHSFLLSLFLGARALGLGPLAHSPHRGWFAGPLFLVLLLSLFVGGGGGGRQAGVFVNSNNFALMSFAMLLLVDPKRDRPGLLRALHGFLVLVLAAAGTVGAFTGYVGAWAWRIRRGLLRPWALALLLAAAGSAWFLLTATELEERAASSHLLQRVTAQWNALRTHSADALSGSVDFGAVVQQTGEGSGSGVWRILHWGRALGAWARSGWGTMVLGTGIGTFAERFGAMAHNDYLRILIEQGIVGFLAFGWLLVSLVRRIPEERRFGAVAFLIYCVSENNLDNVLFMSLWILFLAGEWGPRGVPVREGRGGA